MGKKIFHSVCCFFFWFFFNLVTIWGNVHDFESIVVEIGISLAKSFRLSLPALLIALGTSAGIFTRVSTGTL